MSLRVERWEEGDDRRVERWEGISAECIWQSTVNRRPNRLIWLHCRPHFGNPSMIAPTFRRPKRFRPEAIHRYDKSPKFFKNTTTTNRQKFWSKTPEPLTQTRNGSPERTLSSGPVSGSGRFHFWPILVNLQATKFKSASQLPVCFISMVIFEGALPLDALSQVMGKTPAAGDV